MRSITFALTLVTLLTGSVAPSANLPTPPNASIEATEAFRAECAAKAKAALAGNSITAKGRDGWLFFGPELRHISVGRFWGDRAIDVSQASNAEFADPIPAILDFKAQLDKAGIELILLPVPPKSVVYADKLTAKIQMLPQGLPRFDLAHQEFYAELRAKGVNVLDVATDFFAHRSDADATYCRQDTHWSGRACVLAARRIAETVRDRAWLAPIPKGKFSEAWRRVAISGDLMMAGDKSPREVLPLRFVGTPDPAAKTTGGLKPVETQRDSPVLLLGDSHALVFHDGEDMHTKGAGLADQLALELGFAVDLIAVRGSGATPARTDLMRRARKDANYLAGKKLVVWCFSAREFTETMGWQKVVLGK